MIRPCGTATAGHLGGAGPADDHRAGQWTLPVAGAAQPPERNSRGRGAGRPGCERQPIGVGGRDVPVSRARPFSATWSGPLAFGFLSAAGLVAGLLADGIWDWISWIGLGSGCAACGWYGLFGGRLRKGRLDIIDRDPTAVLAVDTDAPCGEPRQ